jgi:altronate dehydratase
MSIEHKKFIIMNPKDNCATSLENILKDSEIEINNTILKLNQNIPLGHKFALLNIKKGELIKKYGEIIGVATQDIKEGDWIHIHNVKSHYLEKVEK